MKRIKRGIKPYEVVHTFNYKNKRVAFRQDQKLILKVYDKRKKKYVGAFNPIRKDKPVPRFFGRVQKKLYELQKTPVFRKAHEPGYSFKIRPSQLVKHQIPTRVLQQIKQKARQGKAFQIRMELSFGKRKPKTVMTTNPAWSLGKRLSNDDIRKIFTVEMIKLASGRSVRFSNKLLTRNANKNKPQVRSAKITVNYIDLSELGVQDAKNIRAVKTKSGKLERQSKRKRANKKKPKVRKRRSKKGS